MHKIYKAIAIAAIIFLIAIYFVWYQINLNSTIADDTPKNQGYAPPKQLDNAFSEEDLRAALNDYDTAIEEKDKVNIRVDQARVKNLKLLLLNKDTANSDKALREFLFNANISRGEKIITLINLLNESQNDDEKTYLLDALSSLHPLEFIGDLERFFKSKNNSKEINARIILACESAAAFTPSGKISEATANLLNYNITKAQVFLKELVVTSDIDTQKLALMSFVKIAPQAEAHHLMEQYINNPSFSMQEKIDLQFDVAISEPSNYQSIIIEKMITTSRDDPKSAHIYDQKIIGVLGSAEQRFTSSINNQTRLALDNYLLTKEPAVTDEALSSINYYNWAKAVSFVESNSTINQDKVLLNRILQESDTQKISSMIGLSNEYIIESIHKNGNINSIKGILIQGLNGASEVQQQRINEALSKINSYKN